jgi:aminoglycoside phosphotransferase family enzyme
MAFILSTDLPDTDSNIFLKRHREQFKNYRQYLQNIKHKLKPATQEFALAEWHYDGSDPRCLHDAWLESVTLQELPIRDDLQNRRQEIVIRLLGAYHDGHVELAYREVSSYTFDQPYRWVKEGMVNRCHGDWLVDEVRLSDNGKIIHEIEWENRGHWIIECNDIEYLWIPIVKKDEEKR